MNIKQVIYIFYNNLDASDHHSKLISVDMDQPIVPQVLQQVINDQDLIDNLIPRFVKTSTGYLFVGEEYNRIIIF